MKNPVVFENTYVCKIYDLKIEFETNFKFALMYQKNRTK